MEEIHQIIFTTSLIVFLAWIGYRCIRHIKQNIPKVPDQLKDINEEAKKISHRLDDDMTHYINHIKRTKNKKKK